eukprot:ANDGO_05868.mRNA.1 putative cysteine protease ATG4
MFTYLSNWIFRRRLKKYQMDSDSHKPTNHSHSHHSRTHHRHQHHHHSSSSTASTSHKHKDQSRGSSNMKTGFLMSTGSDVPYWVLGQCYGSTDDEEFMRDVRTLVWCTYRSQMKESVVASDSGWGCMHRTGQMLMAQTLVRLFIGREFRLPSAANADVRIEMARLTVREPGQESAGNDNSSGDDGGDVDVDEAAANAEADAKSYQAIVKRFMDLSGPQHAMSLHNIVHVARDFGKGIGTWLGPNTMCHVLAKLVKTTMGTEDVLDVVVPDGGGLYSSDIKSRSFPLLILAPLKLSLDAYVPGAFAPQISVLFKLHQCVGMIGGRPRSSAYFFGTRGNDTLLFLDPHTTQAAPQSADDLSSFQYKGALNAMPITHLDPSFAVGFLCTDPSDWESLFQTLCEICAHHPSNPMFDVRETNPLGPSAANLHASDPFEDEDTGDAAAGAKKSVEDDFEIL